MIRDLNLNDLRILENDAKFPLPNLNNKLYTIQKSVEINDELIGAFWVKITSELSLVASNATGPLKRIKMLLEINHYVKEQLKLLGIDDIHVFIDDLEFSELLKTHFGFSEATGKALYRRI